MAPQLYVTIAIWSQVVSAVVFIATLVYLWFRFLQPVVLAAQEHSNEQIAEAERHRDDAKRALAALHEEIEGARHDAELIRQRATQEAERERRVALAEAEQEGRRALQNAQGELGRARAAARRRFREELVERALAEARERAKRAVDARANARLVEGFLGSLGASHD
jgi:F0F1-type ATP synthase membrane subunit b/b'